MIRFLVRNEKINKRQQTVKCRTGKVLYNKNSHMQFMEETINSSCTAFREFINRPFIHQPVVHDLVLTITADIVVMPTSKAAHQSIIFLSRLSRD